MSKTQKEVNKLWDIRRDQSWLIPTNDDWYPTREDGKVLARTFVYYLLKERAYYAKACVWGDDDFGLEVEAYSVGCNEAYDLYNEWKARFSKMTIVYQKDLISLGMKRA